jgi:hypothetical protein
MHADKRKYPDVELFNKMRLSKFSMDEEYLDSVPTMYLVSMTKHIVPINYKPVKYHEWDADEEDSLHDHSEQENACREYEAHSEGTKCAFRVLQELWSRRDCLSAVVSCTDQVGSKITDQASRTYLMSLGYIGGIAYDRSIAPVAQVQEILVKHGAQLPYGYNRYLTAAACGMVDIVKEGISTKGIDWEEHSFYIFKNACASGNLDLVKLVEPYFRHKSPVLYLRAFEEALFKNNFHVCDYLKPKTRVTDPEK